MDDVFQTQMDMSKRQKMSKKAIAHLDALIVDLKKRQHTASEEEEEVKEGHEESKEGDIMRDIH